MVAYGVTNSGAPGAGAAGTPTASSPAMPRDLTQDYYPEGTTKWEQWDRWYKRDHPRGDEHRRKPQGLLQGLFNNLIWNTEGLGSGSVKKGFGALSQQQQGRKAALEANRRAQPPRIPVMQPMSVTGPAGRLNRSLDRSRFGLFG